MSDDSANAVLLAAVALLLGCFNTIALSWTRLPFSVLQLVSPTLSWVLLQKAMLQQAMVPSFGLFPCQVPAAGTAALQYLQVDSN